MAAATETTLGTVIGEGGDFLFSNGTNPTLTPTGVSAGGPYLCPELVVNVKGQVLYIGDELSSADVPCATVFSCGIVQIGDNITVNSGEISIPLATTSTKGVFQIGNGFVMDGCYLNLDYEIATTSLAGTVIVPTSGNIDVDGSGNISVPIATDSVVGIFSIGSGLSVSSGNVTLDLPIATDTVLGGVIAGTGFTVDGSGVLSFNTADFIATDSELGLIMVPGGDGLNVDVSGNVTFTDPIATTTTCGQVIVPSSGNLEIDGSGNISVLLASSSNVGVFSVGSGLNVDGLGEVTLDLPIATDTVLGGIKIGTGFSIDGSGILSSGVASGTELGTVIVPESGNLDIDGSGNISVPLATDSTVGVVKSANTNNISISSGEVNIGSNIPKKNTANIFFAKAQQDSIESTTSGSSFTPDLSLSSTWVVTLNDATPTINAPTNAVVGGVYLFSMKQDATGNRVPSFASNYLFPDGTAPTFTTTANATDLLQLMCIDSTPTFVCDFVNDFS